MIVRHYFLIALDLVGLALTQFAPDLVMPYLFAIFAVDAAMQLDQAEGKY